MLLTMRNQYRKQKGFSLLEALLAIVIIVAAGLGVVELFISADKKNKLQATQQVVQQVSGAANQFLATSYDPADVLNTQNLIDSGLLPKNIHTANDINSPYGTITLTPDATTRIKFIITVPNVPGEQAVGLCQNMFSGAAVFKGAAASGSAGTSLLTCKSIFTGAGSTAITFGFPREAYALSTS